MYIPQPGMRMLQSEEASFTLYYVAPNTMLLYHIREPQFVECYICPVVAAAIPDQMKNGTSKLEYTNCSKKISPLAFVPYSHLLPRPNKLIQTN
jgi:hypothetical protein